MVDAGVLESFKIAILETKTNKQNVYYTFVEWN